MPFQCQKCFKTFTGQSNLDKHNNRQKPCISEEIGINMLTCTFCNNQYSSCLNLKKHMEKCPIKSNPQLLIKQFEKVVAQKNELIIQKDALIEQQLATIEQLKDIKPTNIDNSTNVDNSTNNIDNSTNTDNSTTNITNNNLHIHIDQLPYGFRSSDMEYMINDLSQTDEGFRELQHTMMKHAKDGDVKSAIGSFITYIHDNPNLKRGQNLRYCNEGKHKGKTLVYDYDKDGIGSWYIADIVPISKVISKEFQEMRKKQEEANEKLPTHKQEKYSKKELKNIAEYDLESQQLHTNINHRDGIFKVVKRFKISKEQIGQIKEKWALNLDTELSPVAKKDSENAEDRYEEAKKIQMEQNKLKTKAIMEKNRREREKLKKQNNDDDGSYSDSESESEKPTCASEDSEETKQRRWQEKQEYDEQQRLKKEEERKELEAKYEEEDLIAYNKQMQKENEEWAKIKLPEIELPKMELPKNKKSNKK